MVRASVFGCRTFPDLWLTYVTTSWVKWSLWVNQPGKLSITSGSVNDYGGEDHYTADQGCVWLFGRRSKSVGADS